MPIVVTCRCGKSYSANDNLVGKSLPCPNCQAVIQVPGGLADPLGMGTASPGSPFSTPAGMSQDPFGMNMGMAGAGQPNYAQPSYAPTPYGNSAAPKKSGASKGLIIGLVAALGGLALIGLIAVVAIFVVIPALEEKVTWVAHSPADAYYSVDFPGNPVRETLSQATPMGAISVDQDKVLLSNNRGELMVVATKLPIPEAQARLLIGFAGSQVLEQMSTQMLKSLPESKVINVEAINLGTNQGRELIAEFKRPDGLEAQLHLRAYLAGTRMYMLKWEGPKGREPTKITDRFFQSFQINTPPPEPPSAGKGGGFPGFPGMPGLPKFPSMPQLPGFPPSGNGNGGPPAPPPPR